MLAQKQNTTDKENCAIGHHPNQMMNLNCKMFKTVTKIENKKGGGGKWYHSFCWYSVVMQAPSATD